jgi:hypothetical protein
VVSGKGRLAVWLLVERFLSDDNDDDDGNNDDDGDNYGDDDVDDDDDDDNDDDGDDDDNDDGDVYLIELQPVGYKNLYTDQPKRHNKYKKKSKQQINKWLVENNITKQN